MTFQIAIHLFYKKDHGWYNKVFFDCLKRNKQAPLISCFKEYIYCLIKINGCFALRLAKSLFVWCFSSYSRIFHSYGDVTITSEGLPNFDLGTHVHLAVKVV